MYQSARSLPGTFSTSLGSAPPVPLSPPPASLPRSNREILFTVELFYWIPALLVAIHILSKQGFRQHLGWLYIIALALIRVVGASTGIASVHTSTSSLTSVSITCTHVGLISSITALTSIVLFANNRVSDSNSTSLITPSTLLHLGILSSFVLTVVGGLAQLQVLTQLSIAFIAPVILALTSLTIYSDTSLPPNNPSEARLVSVCLASLPFILVRLVYGWMSSFIEEGSLFDLTIEDAGAVVARAAMQVSVEVVVMSLWLLVGMAEERDWDEAAEMGGRSRGERTLVHGSAVETTMAQIELGLREALACKGTVTGATREQDEAACLLPSEEKANDEDESDED